MYNSKILHKTMRARMKIEIEKIADQKYQLNLVAIDNKHDYSFKNLAW